MIKASVSALAVLLAMPAARADAIPPPVEHTALQERLAGLWQEQTCHQQQPVMHHSIPCEIRTIAFADSTVAIISLISVREVSNAQGTSGGWSEVSSDTNTAVIRVEPDLGNPDWKLSFPDKDSLVIAAYGAFPDARFKRIHPAQ